MLFQLILLLFHCLLWSTCMLCLVYNLFWILADTSVIHRSWVEKHNQCRCVQTGHKGCMMNEWFYEYEKDVNHIWPLQSLPHLDSSYRKRWCASEPERKPSHHLPNPAYSTRIISCVYTVLCVSYFPHFLLQFCFFSFHFLKTRWVWSLYMAPLHCHSSLFPLSSTWIFC